MNLDTWQDNKVPLVEPADVKAAWTLQEKIQAEHPGKEFSIDAELYRRACSPGASVGAVRYRLSHLLMLSMYGQATGAELPWLHPEPHDAVFKVLATIPMTGMPDGGHNIPPTDVEKLVRLVQKEYQDFFGQG